LEIEEINSTLKELNNSNPEILLSMLVSSDGFTIAHEGDVEDSDRVGALYIELQLVCNKIMSELQYDELEEMFIRSKSGCVTIMPIRDKGLIACMSTPKLNAGNLQILVWRAASKLSNIL